MLNQIVAHCDKAHELVEAQTKRFQELRDLERRAPEVLAEQERRVSEADTRLRRSSRRWRSCRASGSSQAVHGNIAEARGGWRSPAGRPDGLPRSRAATRGGGASRQGSQDALAQAAALLDAIEREGAALEEARKASTRRWPAHARTWIRRARRWRVRPTRTSRTS